MNLYHLSSMNMNGKTIFPRVPENFFTKNGYEDSKTKRVCFSTSIDGCLRGMSQNLTNKKFYVHIPDPSYKFNVYTPTTDEVPDSEITGEVWITKPVKLKCISLIEVIGDTGEDGIKFTYGDKEAELYYWNWREVNTRYNKIFEKLHEKVSSGEITLEFATEVCNIAYDKYMKEASEKDTMIAANKGLENRSLRKGARISNQLANKEVEIDENIKFIPDKEYSKNTKPINIEKSSKSGLKENDKKRNAKAIARSSDTAIPNYGANPNFSRDADKRAIKKFKDSKKYKDYDSDKSSKNISNNPTKQKIIKRRIEQGKDLPENISKKLIKKNTEEPIQNEKSGNTFFQKHFDSKDDPTLKKLRSLYDTMNRTHDYTEYKKCHREFTRLTGINPNSSIGQIMFEGNSIIFNIHKGGKGIINTDDSKFTHNSSNSNINELLPTFKSSDSSFNSRVFHPDPRVYFYRNRSGSRVGGSSTDDKSSNYEKQDKTSKYYEDPELRGGNAVYIKGRKAIKIKKNINKSED